MKKKRLQVAARFPRASQSKRTRPAKKKFPTLPTTETKPRPVIDAIN
jgi:hypothetical protein